MGKVLIISTSHKQLGSTGEDTGLWLGELSGPYYIFANAGFDVTVASPKGGNIPIDAASLADNYKTPSDDKFLADSSAKAAIEQSVALDSISEEYDAYFLPGGHGVMWDFPGNQKLAGLISSAFANGKVVSAVCHGPAGLLDATAPNGKPLVSGRKVTGFTNTEEEAVGKTQAVPFLLEDKLKEAGGLYERGDDWAPYAVVDGRLVTGQNPFSSEKVAELVVGLL
jgi:putative intracellular protease/amidase